jgi:hypothetical protein
MEEEPDPWSGAPTPERQENGVQGALGGLARLVGGLSGAATPATGNLIGESWSKAVVSFADLADPVQRTRMSHRSIRPT